MTGSTCQLIYRKKTAITSVSSLALYESRDACIRFWGSLMSIAEATPGRDRISWLTTSGLVAMFRVSLNPTCKKRCMLNPII